MKTNVSLEEALAILLDKTTDVGQKNNNLTDTIGRILSEDIFAQEDVPPFPRSPYDGFAFRTDDTMDACPETPVILEVIEEVPAGYTAKNAVGRGQAIKILTGAPIPEGADAVCKFEETSLAGNKEPCADPINIWKVSSRQGKTLPKEQKLPEGERLSLLP